MEEIWKDIEGYEGLYQISNLGRVKSLKRTDSLGRLKKERINKPDLSTAGYPMITLYKNGKRSRKLIHRLIAIAFIPNPNNYPVVNHKDENPKNYSINNLEWCTYRYNNTYGKALKNKFKSVTLYDVEGNIVKKFDSINQGALEIYGDISMASSITLCCQGRLIQHCGDIWRYGDDPFDLYRTPTMDNIKSKKRCAVCQYDTQGNLIASYKSLRDAADSIGGYFSSISQVCKGKAYTHKGYVWRFQEDSFDKFFVPQFPNETISKKVAQCDLDGNIINIFQSIKEAVKSVGGSSCGIVETCKGRQRTHIGYMWKYIDQI